jgi:acetate kinase
VTGLLILVVNCGSSSLKYTLFNRDEEWAAGLVEKIGEKSSNFSRAVRGEKKIPALSLAVANHEQAIGLMMEWLIQDGLIPNAEAINAVGHRVVHGGPNFKAAALVDERVRNNTIAKDLAPLHWVNYEGIEACVKMMPRTPQVAVFDTAFHQTMPEKAFVYALPYRYFTEMKIRRYGAHGTSHKYVSQRCIQLLKKPAARVNCITLHLGNGSSLAAVRAGVCVDTSMGLTPLAGVVMGSRCGDIDPAIVPFIMEREAMNPSRVDRLMNKESGLLGLSGVSNDLREVIAQADQGSERSQLALDVFVYSIQKYIGSYHAVLGRTDALVFTAGIGEKSPLIRKRICDGLAGLGVKLDPARNRKAVSQEMFIHKPGSKIKIAVIPTREEYMISLETQRVIEGVG